MYSVADLPCSQIIHTDVSYQFLYFILNILHYGYAVWFLRIKMCIKKDVLFYSLSSMLDYFINH